MDREDLITMSRREHKRARVIQQVMEQGVGQKKAGELLDLSDRQIRRMVKRVQEQGETGLAHKLRGKPSNHQKDPTLREKILEAYQSQYPDFGPTLAAEKLGERDGWEVHPETLRLWLKEEQIPYPQRKGRSHRRWRERKECYGEMLQIDGSQHAWLEKRGPLLVLMGYIDDATSRVYARFYLYEGTFPAMDSFKRYVLQNGIPLRVYLDRHTTYKSPQKLSLEEELAGKEQSQSQFQRALAELEVEIIHAQSPQAKGRVERLFGTLQDRLVKELRLANIGTLEEANVFLETFLPRYNQRFAIPATRAIDVHRKAPKKMNLDSILCLKQQRRLRNDFTIAYENRWYQVVDKVRGKIVRVEQWLDGSIHLFDSQKELSYKVLPVKPQKARASLTPRIRIHQPSPDHPWREKVSTSANLVESARVGIP